MNCERYQEFISQFIDGELDNINESDLFRHLGSCELCRTFFKNVISLRSSLAAQSPAVVPVSMDQRVLNPLSRNIKRPALQNFLWLQGKARYSFRVVGLAVVLTALTSIFVSSLWYTSQQPQRTIVCLTPLPEVEVNGYVVVASSPTKGFNQ
ncbi:MAG: hypothetical protein EHM64_02350 [Ignavibacteriae bacterium]|nr:MAG: hypothetical protein EHM64_02350 [Ignavibacteriota bacterium]